MATAFCARCYERLLADLRRRNRNDQTVFVNPAECNFACKIPIYELDDMGRPVVKIWDCVNNITVFYSQEEWLRRQRDEEV